MVEKQIGVPLKELYYGVPGFFKGEAMILPQSFNEAYRTEVRRAIVLVMFIPPVRPFRLLTSEVFPFSHEYAVVLSSILAIVIFH
jgi:hypothetical protein